MCNHPSSKICSGCKSIHYCSTACQKHDWPLHKVVCKDYQEFLPTRPDSSHYSAIYFPADEDKPRFVWMRYEAGHNHPQEVAFAELGLSQEWIDKHDNVASETNPVLKRRYESHCIVLSRPTAEKICPCCTPNGKPNQSISKLDSDLARFCQGAIVAWGVHHTSDIDKRPSDVHLGPADFRSVIDEMRLVEHFWNEKFHELSLGQKGTIVVRLNCQGDQQFLDRPIIEEHVGLLAGCHESQIPTPVADRVGLPLIAYQNTPARVWRDYAPHSGRQNHKACLLNPGQQTAETGSVTLGRKDGKPLLLAHVHALLSYTAAKMADSAPSDLACITPDMLHAERINQVSKENFERFYYEMWQENPFRGRLVPSPFNI
ncbi:uncharacterized protein K460DRAFT_330886 [Cucurbitaria berberidis CBS 394.84]|uniref:MYND-type domain-containing protein n=1 Tax=Cucurbitaria berberidis CBS 394.84 TaxID=1168544 RepID=A0A9P4GQA2_9PLEO|nr:uncharacterized protein K460DRAFT_330886 [Cucurbitaria berberidis CBS 394.84]KAF1849176.1 hypothetical protein K460DRAFT_330886 [Cucurbitaria berberidis CBS 394.84]